MLMPFLPILAFFLDNEALVSAAKADDLKEKYPELADEIDRLADADPTPQKKYLQWSVGQVQSGASVDEVIDVVKQYDKALPRLTGKDKDIGSLKTVADMQAVVDKATKVSTKGDVKKKSRKGGVILHEDDRWMLVRPDTQDASIYYGSNTAWCVSRRELSKNYWYNYFAERNVRFYFLIDKQATPRGEGDTGNYHFSKLAMMIRRGVPLSDEPFQDASNRRPHEGAVEYAIGTVFNDMYELALADAKKQPINTWAFDLMYEDITPDTFISLYEEHLPEIKSEGFKPYNKKIKESIIDVAGRGNKKIDDMFIELCEELSYDPYNTQNERIIRHILTTAVPGHDGYLLPSDMVQRVLSIFSKSKSVLIRSLVAKSPRLTFDIQDALMNDKEPAIQRAILNNPILMWDTETQKKAITKATDPSTEIDAWIGLVLNKELPVNLFENLVRDRKDLDLKQMDDLIEGVLKNAADARLALGLEMGDDEQAASSKKEVDIADKKLDILMKSRNGSAELTEKSALEIARYGSASALQNLFYKISDKRSALNQRPRIDRQRILEEIAISELSNYLVDSFLNMSDDDLLNWPSSHHAIKPLLLVLASNKTLNTEQINSIIKKAVDLFLDEKITETSLDYEETVSYGKIMKELSRNPRINEKNSKFLKKTIEENAAYFADGDLLPNSEFMKQSNRVLMLL